MTNGRALRLAFSKEIIDISTFAAARNMHLEPDVT